MAESAVRQRKQSMPTSAGRPQFFLTTWNVCWSTDRRNCESCPEQKSMGHDWSELERARSMRSIWHGNCCVYTFPRLFYVHVTSSLVSAALLQFTTSSEALHLTALLAVALHQS